MTKAEAIKALRDAGWRVMRDRFNPGLMYCRLPARHVSPEPCTFRPGDWISSSLNTDMRRYPDTPCHTEHAPEVQLRLTTAGLKELAASPVPR